MSCKALEDWQNHGLYTPSYFDFKGQTDEARAAHVFQQIKNLLNISKSASLAPMKKLDTEFRDRFEHVTAAGLFVSDGQGHLIEYDTELASRPTSLLSTLSHELMHLKLAPFVDQMPGGRAQHEQSTDMQAIIHGFGIIQLECASELGWSGYLSQSTRAYATAKFCKLHNISIDRIRPHLSTRNFKLIKKGEAIL